MAFFLDDIIEGAGNLLSYTPAGQAVGVLEDLGGALTGEDAAQAALQAAQMQQQAGQEASALLDPFAAIGQQGLSQSGFLTDPQQQFDFLQSNPLFQLGLNNLNQQTQNVAAARGRLSAGDTLQQLQNNALLAAQPLIQQQKQSIGGLLDYGLNTAQSQGNLLTGQAAAGAGGVIGAANARNQGAQNLLNLGGLLFGLGG